MRILIQRVTSASVTVNGSVSGAIEFGLLLLVGIAHEDTETIKDRLADKIVKLRIFNDDAGLMNRSVLDVGGGILAVSQFTLYADTRKGNRPSYTGAARPEQAAPAFERFVGKLADRLGKPVACGVFGADMNVSLVNDGPVTIWLDSANIMSDPLVSELDHIVVAARTLDEGREWCLTTLGVEPTVGGKHQGLATHNLLLRMGDAAQRHYLEIIAIDPDAPAPAIPRWFGLDGEVVQTQIAQGPRLIAWVARCSGAVDAIERLAQAPGYAANIVRPAARANFRWRFSFTLDGARVADGVLPHLIQWDAAMHPCEHLPHSAVTLGSLMLGAPAPESISEILDAISFVDSRVQIGQSTSRHLVATLQTPLGAVILD